MSRARLAERGSPESPNAEYAGGSAVGASAANTTEQHNSATMNARVRPGMAAKVIASRQVRLEVATSSRTSCLHWQADALAPAPHPLLRHGRGRSHVRQAAGGVRAVARAALAPAAPWRDAQALRPPAGRR